MDPSEEEMVLDDFMEASDAEVLASKFTYTLDRLKISKYSTDSEYVFYDWFVDPLDIWCGNVNKHQTNK